MKISIKKSLWLFVILVTVLFYASCKKDGGQTPLTGAWVKNYLQGKTQYVFNTDGSFEIDDFATDSVTQKVLGYRSKSLGNYTLKGANLAITINRYFYFPNNSYGPASQIVLMQTASVQNYTVAFNTQQTILYLYFTCPPNADCVPSPLIYYKTDVISSL
jgi:hypothetical protein